MADPARQLAKGNDNGSNRRIFSKPDTLVCEVEGIICIGMATPLILPLGALGGWLMYKGA